MFVNHDNITELLDNFDENIEYNFIDVNYESGLEKTSENLTEYFVDSSHNPSLGKNNDNTVEDGVSELNIVIIFCNNNSFYPVI